MHQIILRRFLHFVHPVLRKNYANHHCDIFVAFVEQMLFRFLKFQVKLINFDGVSKSSAIILNF